MPFLPLSNGDRRSGQGSCVQDPSCVRTTGRLLLDFKLRSKAAAVAAVGVWARGPRRSNSAPQAGPCKTEVNAVRGELAALIGVEPSYRVSRRRFQGQAKANYASSATTICLGFSPAAKSSHICR